jgi:ubiquinone/menaquinone biosynthesis C-methylase UbiE
MAIKPGDLMFGRIEHTCPWWLIYTFDNPLRRWFHNGIKMLQPWVKPGQTVVDIGCGMGVFTIPLAQLVGEEGIVYAVDLQEKMLLGLKRRAERAGVQNRIHMIQCQKDDIGLKIKADFVLAFWMVHEVAEPSHFLEQVYQLLKPGGHFLLVEPKMHVTAGNFNTSIQYAEQAGLKTAEPVSAKLSRAALFTK